MKKQLLNLTLILFAIGVVGLVYPFVKSMGPNDRAKNDATLKININNMKVGEVTHIQNAYFKTSAMEPSGN